MGLIHLHGLLLVVCTVICLSGVCYGAVRNEACGGAENCTDGTTCVNGTCVCDTTTHYYLNGACSTKLALGTECPATHAYADGSVCADDNAECGDIGSGIDCVCKDTHYNDTGNCTLKITHGSGTCQSADQCNTTDAVCSDSDTCQCNTTTSYHDSTSDTCLPKNSVALGGSCPSDETSTTTFCSDTNARCNGGTCQCMDGYFQNVTQCFQEGSVALGESCPSDETSTTTFCSDTNARCNGGTCQCMTGYFRMGTQCFQERSVALGDACPSDETSATTFCSDTNARCNGGTCQCMTGYFRMGTQCLAEGSVALGGTCPSNETSTTNTYCNDANARCNGATCQCMNGYFQNGTQCFQEGSVAVGDACPSVETSTTNTYCSDDNARCNGATCQCMNGYFQMNTVCVLERSLAYDASCPVDESGSAGSSVFCKENNVMCLSGGSGLKCLCRTGYFRNGNTCTQGGTLPHGDNCPASETNGPGASQYCSGDHVKCLPVSDGATTYSCQCTTGYFWNDSTCASERSVAVGGACPSVETTTNTYCFDNNARCTLVTGSSYTCQCRSGYFTMGSACLQDNSVSLGRTCPQVESDTTTYCSDNNALCTGTTGSTTCQCKTGFFEMNSVCVPDKSIQLNQECPSLESGEQSVFCRIDKSICLQSGNTFTCQCADGYFENGGVCDQDRSVRLDGSCPSAETDSTRFCQDVNARCTLVSGPSTYTCQCKDTHFNDGTTCVTKNSVAIGQACPVAEVSSNIYCSDTNARCTGTGGTTTCQCIDSHFVFGTTCVSDNSIALNGGCPGHESLEKPTEYCNDSNARCSGSESIYTCVCMTGYFVHNSVCMRDMSLDLGATCPGPEQSASPTTYCSDPNARCSGTSSPYTCMCLSTYYDSNTAATSGGTCVAKVELGVSCPQPDACGTANSTCSSGTCRCVTTHYDDNGLTVTGGQCVLKVALGYRCPQPEACSTGNAECSGSICKCSENYYDDNTENSLGGTCRLRKYLNSDCDDEGNAKQCFESGATCRSSQTSGSMTCQCDPSYYPDDLLCIPRNGLGDSCQVCSDGTTDCGQCSDSNAECFNNASCRCKVGFYDDNGITNSGTCKPVDELGVTGITFPLVENTQLGMSWSAPSVGTSVVTEYVVVWRPKDNAISGDSQHVGAGSTRVSITGLTAGKAYTITVTTVNSAAGYYRNASSTTSQATKPYPPTLNLGNSNFNVQNNRILIAWNQPSGGVSGYSVQLFDKESTLVGEAQPTLSSTFLNGSNAVLKHGYNYTLVIVSRSEKYDNEKTVESDTLQKFVKTVVTAPAEPTSVQCVSSEAESIMLTWTAPTLPNGDLLQYIIKVRIYPTMAIVDEHPTSSTSTEFTVLGLTSGTSYSFDVYTVNEQYNSSLPGSTQQYCSTKAKQAEVPRNVTIASKTNRTVGVSWNSPAKLFAEENLGYLVIVKPTDTMSCKEEVYYNCSDCVQSINKTLTTCPSSKSKVIMTSAEALKDLSFNYIFEGLLPDTEYEISIAAINNFGLGDKSFITAVTNEEEPQKPSKPTVFGKTQTSFQVSWNLAAPRPGKVTYTVHVTANPSAPSKTLTTSGFTNTTLTVSGLEENWGYEVQVTAATLVGSKTSDVSDKVTTLTAAPGVVDQFKVTSAPGGNYTQIRVSWKIPSILERNSIIKQFVFIHNTSSVTAVNKTINKNSDDAYDYIEHLTVTPEQYYSFKVYAVNEQDEIGASSINVIMAPPGVPISFIDETVTKVVQMQEVQETQISLRIYTDFLDQTTYGAIRETGLIGCASSLCKLSDFANMPLSDFQSMDNWQKAKDKGYSTYRITKASWLDDMSPQVSRRRRSIADTIPFTVGTEGCSADEYCNGPLKADTEYIIVVVTCTNGGCLLSEQYGPFKTKAVPPEVPVGLIVGVVVGVVVVAAIVAAVVFLVVRRRRLGSPMKHIKDEEPEFDITETKNIPRKRPICLNDFEGYIKDLHKDSNLKFSAEYEELKDLSPKHPCLNSDLEENRAKNRYINIIPFDHTRVKLLASGESDTEDYINANYLPGYSSPREYIGCQGPLPGTIDDFWRMTWEQNVHVIVMLTLCKEGNKIKCEQYWPTEVNDPKQFGDVVVEVSSYSSMKTYDYRMFKLTVQGKTRVVKHFHFLTWQDFQANVRHDIILDFIRSVRSHIQPPDTVGPAIIHCSAGVGRTGTYIALDHLMQFINDHDFHVDVDIFDLVLKMRENRSFMVQTEQQYIFIHDCVKEMLEDKRRKEESIYENQGVQVGENIYANSENEQSLYENWQSGSVQKTVL